VKSTAAGYHEAELKAVGVSLGGHPRQSCGAASTRRCNWRNCIGPFSDSCVAANVNWFCEKAVARSMTWHLGTASGLLALAAEMQRRTAALLFAGAVALARPHSGVINSEPQPLGDTSPVLND
jgi:hypothetical protein